MEKHEKYLIAGVIIGVLGVLLVVGILKFTQTYQYEIVSHNGVLGTDLDENWNLIYTYTVYVKVKNVLGISNTITIYCEITREDLTTITKSQTITLNKGEVKTITFFFSNEELKGSIPHQYRIYGD